ncbi:hypothetical protein LDG_5682 [Legionella drancourtii LLAP12]|uniref:Uncharacterized protein n=1 Tax=Legionella drancourtii LLAP12 TaxID=658187 RepID=G9EKF1_9GAMM|nr:hypothetical protein LDG_5682 [Legionella drancourtii LLAP12]
MSAPVIGKDPKEVMSVFICERSLSYYKAHSICTLNAPFELILKL